MRFFSQSGRLPFSARCGLSVALLVAALLWTTSVAQATIIVPSYQLGSPQYQETVPPGFTPSGSATLASDSANTDSNAFGGFASGLFMETGGSLDFTTSSNFTAGGSVTLNYSVDYLMYDSLNDPWPLSGIDAYGAIGIGGNGTFSTNNSDPNTAPQITAFTVSAALLDQSGSQFSPSDGSATLSLVNSNSPQSLPYDSFGGDDNALGSVGQNQGSVLNLNGTTLSTSFTVPGSVTNVDFRQTVSVTFSGLQPNETVYVNFPNSGNINPQVAAPEPSSLTLLGIGACGLMGYARRRRQKRCDDLSIRAKR